MKARELVNRIKIKRGQLWAVFLLLILLIMSISYKGDGYFKFLNQVFYLNEKVDSSDSWNFRVLENGFARDDVSLYYKGYNFRRGIPIDFKIIDDKYCVDGLYAYMYFPGRRILKIPNSDAKTFEVLDHEGYSMDKNNHYYFDGNDFYFMANEGFEFIDDNEEYNARDEFRYYKDGKMVKMTQEWDDHLTGISDKIKEQEAERQMKSNISSRKKINDFYIRELFKESNDRGLFANIGTWQYFPIYNLKCVSTTEEALSELYDYQEKPYTYINDKNVQTNISCVEGGTCTDSGGWDVIKTELGKNQYNIINGCLYKNGDNVFEYNLLVKKNLGEFNPEDNLENNNYSKSIPWDGVREWFRFEDGNYLYIYLKGAAGCGGCIFNGPYLKINKIDGSVLLGDTEIGYLPYVELSEDKKFAIVTEIDYKKDKDNKYNGERDITLYLYDLVNDKKMKELYRLPDDRTFLVEGDGTYILGDSIKWINENEIQITLYDRDGEGETKRGGTFINKDGYSELDYLGKNEPFVINVNN